MLSATTGCVFEVIFFIELFRFCVAAIDYRRAMVQVQQFPHLQCLTKFAARDVDTEFSQQSSVSMQALEVKPQAIFETLLRSFFLRI